MKQLTNKTKNKTLATHLDVASNFSTRAKGLLGKDNLPQGHALLIKNCSSIHTFFMKFDLDVIFVDRNLKVTSIHTNIPAWRLVIPRWGSKDVIEMASGQLSSAIVETGDELYVGN